MKYRYRSLLCCFFLLICLNAWAKDNLLQFVVSGLHSNGVRKNVEQTLDNLRSTLPKSPTTAEVKTLFEGSPKAIKQAMQPFGYFHATVSKHLYVGKHHWIASYTIHSGAPVKITKLDTQLSGSGKNSPHFTKLLKHLPLHLGQTLNTEDYDKAKRKFFTLAANRGYFKAKLLKAKILINLHNNHSTVILHFYTGPRYRFGKTTFSASPLNIHFLRRYLQYKPGEYYSIQKVDNTQQDLVTSGYFKQVIVSPMPTKAKGLVVPIHIQLIRLKAHTYTFGVGFGTDTGPRGSIGITLRHLGGYGHRMSFFVRASQRDSTGNISYIIPGAHPARENFSFSASGGSYSQTNAESSGGQLNAAYNNTFGHLQQTLGLTYLIERSLIPNLLPFRVTSSILYPSISWEYLRTDGGKLNPRNGIRLDLNLSGASRGILSKTNFFEAIGGIKALTTFSPTHTRLIVRATYGYLSVKNLANIPYSLQLFNGGARSVRGYEYNEFGPGHDLFDASVEIQQRFYGNWYIAGFVDAGNVAIKAKQLFRNINVGVGPALVWLSPIGPLEVSVANAVTKKGRPWAIQFTMGPEF